MRAHTQTTEATPHARGQHCLPHPLQVLGPALSTLSTTLPTLENAVGSLGAASARLSAEAAPGITALNAALSNLNIQLRGMPEEE